MKNDFLGSITSIIGALIIASNLGINFVGFFLFFISNLFWIKFSFEEKNKHIFIMNLVFAVINIIGMYNYIKAN
jgi:hypothetical protein